MLFIKKLNLRYKNKVIFDDADFRVEKGDCVLLKGKSGIGKTSLLDVIAGLRNCQSITYSYEGKKFLFKDDEVMSEFRKKNISYIPQDFALIEDYTVLENLQLPFYYYTNIPKVSIDESIENLLKCFDLEHIIHQKVRNISGGQKQRISFIRGIIQDKPIVLADEPTANLDDENAFLIQKLLQKQKLAGKIVIISSHDPRLIPIVDRVCFIQNGKIIEQ